MQANKCKVELYLLVLFHIAIAMSDFHSDYSLAIKVESSVSATLRTNRFTEVPFSLEILQAHKASAVTNVMEEDHYMIYVCGLESYFLCISKLEMVEDQRQRDLFTQEKENAQTKVT